MIKEDIKFQDSSVFEGMTSIRAILRGNDSNINENDDKYVKVSKIVFTIILAPIISLGYFFLIVLYFPMAIFTLWTDVLSFIVCKGESASFNISKHLLTFNK